MSVTMKQLYDPVNSALILTLLSLLFWALLARLAHRLGVRESTLMTAPLSWLTAWAVFSALPAVAHYVSLWLAA